MSKVCFPILCCNCTFIHAVCIYRFESSVSGEGKIISLEEYVSRMPEGQREIYYLCVPGRQHAESSPYYEGFKAKGWEVLFLYSTLDDFVMTNLGEYPLPPSRLVFFRFL